MGNNNQKNQNKSNSDHLIMSIERRGFTVNNTRQPEPPKPIRDSRLTEDARSKSMPGTTKGSFTTDNLRSPIEQSQEEEDD